MATQKEVAELIDLSPRRVSDLVKKSILPGSKGTNGYDLTACNHAYISYLRGIANGQVGPEPGELDVKEETARNLAARTEKTQFELGVLQDDYVHISVLEDILSKFATEEANSFDSARSKIKQQYPTMPADHLEGVVRLFGRGRNKVADFRLK